MSLQRQDTNLMHTQCVSRICIPFFLTHIVFCRGNMGIRYDKSKQQSINLFKPPFAIVFLFATSMYEAFKIYAIDKNYVHNT